MIWLFAITGITLALWMIVQPFFASHTLHWVDSRLPNFMRRKFLREEKGKCIVALRELDFDYETGKLSADDYKELRTKYENRAIVIMKEQDDLNARWTKAQTEAVKALSEISPPSPSPAVKPIETTQADSACSSCQASVQSNDRFCPQCGKDLGSFCSQCGTQTKADDKFCAKCGNSLKGASS